MKVSRVRSTWATAAQLCSTIYGILAITYLLKRSLAHAVVDDAKLLTVALQLAENVGPGECGVVDLVLQLTLSMEDDRILGVSSEAILSTNCVQQGSIQHRSAQCVLDTEDSKLFCCYRPFHVTRRSSSSEDVNKVHLVDILAA